MRRFWIFDGSTSFTKGFGFWIESSNSPNPRPEGGKGEGLAEAENKRVETKCLHSERARPSVAARSDRRRKEIVDTTALAPAQWI